MSFLSSLSSLNPLSMVSNAVESTFDAVLPKQLEFLGDAAGILTDLETGNYTKLLDDAQDLFKDLPQQLSELNKQCGGAAAAGAGGAVDLLSPTSGLLEPTPPAPYTASAAPEEGTAPGIQGHARSTPFGRRESASPPIAGGDAKPITGPVLRGRPPADQANKADKPDTIAKPDQAEKPKKTSGVVETAGAATEPSSTENKTKEPEGKKAETTEASKSMSPDAFFNLSDKGLMDAVRDGKIPDSVKNDPEQMRRLQVRMEDISQMNALITGMLNTMHEMNKAIIQNLRV